MSEFTDYLSVLLEKDGYIASKDAILKMEAYYNELVETNKQYNLTAVTEPKEAALKHFYDSIVPCTLIANGASVVDVGSGAGFPIVPLKIMREDIDAVAVEASLKKCTFIEKATKEIDIDVEVVTARAEELGQGIDRENYDVCVSRAVAKLRVLVELCSPLVKQGGLFFAYKGEYEKELEESKDALKALNLELKEVMEMPHGEYAHHILVFQKTASTAKKYPRRYAQIIKAPL